MINRINNPNFTDAYRQHYKAYIEGRTGNLQARVENCRDFINNLETITCIKDDIVHLVGIAGYDARVATIALMMEGIVI